MMAIRALNRAQIEDPQWAIGRLEDFNSAANAWHEHVDNAFNVRAEANRIRTELKAAEAEVVVNGGHGEFTISGRNAEERAAQTLVAMRSMETYRKAMDELRLQERTQSEHENEAEAALHDMRAARVVLEYAAAWLHYQAGFKEPAQITEDREHGN